MIPISIYYAAYFGALGMFFPYFAPLLVSFGLSPAEATQVVATSPLCGMFVPPVLGLLADAQRAQQRILRLLSLGAVVAFAGFLLASRARWVIFPVALVFNVCRAPLISLVDASAVAAARAAGVSYGRLRKWGSLGFLAAALGAGELVARAGAWAILPASLVLLGAAAVAAWRVPGTVGPRVPVLRVWLERLRRPSMAVFLVTALLASMAHAAYDSGFSLHLSSIGLDGRFIGFAWSIGTAAEVLLIGASGRLLKRWGADRLLCVATLSGALRWLLLAHVREPLLILAAAPLHALSFGLLWVSGVTLAHQQGSSRTPTASQGLFVAAAALGSFTGMSFAGRALAAWGGRGLFLAAAAVAGLATVCALIFSSRLRGK